MLRLDFIKGLLSTAIISPFYTLEKKDYQKIYISQFFIAGFRHYKGMELLENMRVGDMLSLEREPENNYDDCAIALLWKGEKIGFVPSDQNEMLSVMLDADDLTFIGEITHIQTETKPWENIAVAISYLKKLKNGEAKKIPEYLTKVDEPVYKTKINSFKIDVDSEDENPVEMNGSFQSYDVSENVVLHLGDFVTRDMKKKKREMLKYCPIIKDKKSNDYFLITTDDRYSFLYEVNHSKWMEDENGNQYIRGMFCSEKTMKPIDNTQ